MLMSNAVKLLFSAILVDHSDVERVAAVVAKAAESLGSVHWEFTVEPIASPQPSGEPPPVQDPAALVDALLKEASDLDSDEPAAEPDTDPDELAQAPDDADTLSDKDEQPGELEEA